MFKQGGIMTVKELITILLDMDMNKEISIEYPSNSGLIVQPL